MAKGLSDSVQAAVTMAAFSLSSMGAIVVAAGSVPPYVGLIFVMLGALGMGLKEALGALSAGEIRPGAGT